MTAVVLSKHDFADLDNPLLSWMLDYDAVANVLKVGTCCTHTLPCSCPRSPSLCVCVEVLVQDEIAWHGLGSGVAGATCLLPQHAPACVPAVLRSCKSTTLQSLRPAYFQWS